MKRLDFASTLRHIKHAQKKMTTKVKQKKQHRALEKKIRRKNHFKPQQHHRVLWFSRKPILCVEG